MGPAVAGIGWLNASRQPFWPRSSRAAIDNSKIHDVCGLQVRLPRVEDLLVMKAVARRPKDLQDIEGLLAAHPTSLPFGGGSASLLLP
jgi:hypothetical protein